MPVAASNVDPIDVVVAGHICVDLAPELSAAQTQLTELIRPGGLTHVGRAQLSLGGAVANTGLALHQLGAKATLCGLLGDDWLGDATLATLRGHDVSLGQQMRIAERQASSYTIVISPPGVDRAFLHCSGTNDLFVAEDIDLELAMRARWLHFGYPPLMRGVLVDSGESLAAQFARIQQAGTIVSLDMAMPDPHALSGSITWRDSLATVLPHVDLFAPSFDEIVWMLDRPKFNLLASQAGGGNLAAVADGSLLDELSQQVLDWGAPLVAIKLGDQGLYFRSAADLTSLSRWAHSWLPANAEWAGRELLAPCFQVSVAGTTGAGDCTIAGLIMAALHGQSIEDMVRTAVRVGAWRVHLGSTLPLPTWAAMGLGAAAEWKRRLPTLNLADWSTSSDGLYHGPHDGIPAVAA
jgi:sugar/nucleoside kinase (ribokinase family)